MYNKRIISCYNFKFDLNFVHIILIEIIFMYDDNDILKFCIIYIFYLIFITNVHIFVNLLYAI